MNSARVRAARAYPKTKRIVRNFASFVKIDSSKVNIPTSAVSSDGDTELVDRLLAKTTELMGGSDVNNYHHIIAFSGGVDSSLTAALIHRCSTAIETKSERAVLGVSPAVPYDQQILAERIAREIGVDFGTVKTNEGSDEEYIVNTGQACRACKTHLYSTLEAIAGKHRNIEDIRLYNGTNADDTKDTTRVGLVAARDFGVRSPLNEITKLQVRQAAKHMGLSNWNYAASPCLRSRLALGVPATSEHLQRIEEAELFVRNQCKDVMSESTNLRVRLLSGGRACVEVDQEILAHVQSVASGWGNYFTETGKFSDLLVREFRSGSVAR